MDLLDRIETQLISNRLPLVAVTVAAVPFANTPVVLTLHWHGFVETRLADVTDANVVAYQAVPSSALQVNDRWDEILQLENEVLDVAWELGSWDLARVEALPFVRPGASEQESLECMSAFGTHPVGVGHPPPATGPCSAAGAGAAVRTPSSCSSATCRSRGWRRPHPSRALLPSRRHDAQVG